VQTVERFHPPSPFKFLSMEGMVACLDEIEAGVEGEYFSTNRRGTKSERWAGEAIQRHANTLLNDAQTTEVINQWLRSGLLSESTYYSPKQRRNRGCVRVDLSKRDELVNQTGGGFPGPD
jgi:hypothetical protein